ncbi:THAP domain-containing protein 5-like [Temnothorax americanus]|uniref:THAP domain-containing protein 5-like n=1 Tax=Temnothorax americanus TaxID=1964332 RepID=UPI00406807DB
MVKRCEVSGCPVRQGKGLRLFYFPKCEKRRLLWQSWIRVNRPGWSPKTNSRICELHFAPNCYEKRQDGKKILKNTAIPSLQEESLENIENAEHLKSLPERFQTSETRVCLSDVTNFLEAKKSAVLHDSDYLNCSTSASSKIIYNTSFTSLHDIFNFHHQLSLNHHIYSIKNMKRIKLQHVLNMCIEHFNLTLTESGPNMAMLEVMVGMRSL